MDDDKTHNIAFVVTAVVFWGMILGGRRNAVYAVARVIRGSITLEYILELDRLTRLPEVRDL